MTKKSRIILENRSRGSSIGSRGAGTDSEGAFTDPGMY